MKTIEQIKEELIKNGVCKNIPKEYKAEIWKFMQSEFKGKNMNIGDMMHSKEFGICASIGGTGINIFLNEKDYELYYMAI